MFANFDWDAIVRAAPFLFLEGMRFTLSLTVMASIGGTFFGTLLALARLSRNRALSLIAGGYVNFIRSIPLILVIFWFFFLVPYLAQWLTRAAQPIPVSPFWCALVTFTLFEAAYFCEIVRAGIGSLPKGQGEAAAALGMKPSLSFHLVVFPQAFRNMLPLFLTQTIVLFQDTSLVYVVSIVDFLGATSIVAQRDGRLVEFYLCAAVVYFVISLTASQLVRRLEARVALAR